MRLRILFTVLVSVVFLVQGCGGSEPAGIDNAQISDSSGIVLFTDAGSGEEVSVLVVDQTNEPVEGIQVDFLDGDGFETFVAFDPHGEMPPSLSIFPHNSTHTIQMAAEDALPVILELLPGSDEYETVMLFADFLDDFAEQGEAPTGGPDVPENWLYRGVSTPEELEQESKLFLMLLKATPLRPAVEITERGGKLLDILYAMGVVEEPDAYHSWVIVPSLGDSENLAGSIFMLSPIFEEHDADIDTIINQTTLDESINYSPSEIISFNDVEWLVGPDRDLTWHEANEWANSLGGNWRLPTMLELIELWDNGISAMNSGPFDLRIGRLFIWSNESSDVPVGWCFDDMICGGGHETTGTGMDCDLIVGARALARRVRGESASTGDIIQTSDFEQPFDPINTIRPQIVRSVGNEGRSRLLQDSDLSQLSYREIKLVRNYFYACYNRPFIVDWIRNFFLQHIDGYQGNGQNSPTLTEVESSNMIFIQGYERANNIPVMNN